MIISYLTTEEHVAQLQAALVQAVPSARTVTAH
jgi:hypothetical protein